MTNKMKLCFVIGATVFAVLCVLMSTQFVIDIAGRALSVVQNALGLREVTVPSGLAVLAVPGLYLYLAFRRRKHS
jgi:hypothetical protein